MQDLGERSLDWADDRILMVDQTRLPDAYEILEVDDVADLVDAIRCLAVRGAPVIGVAGGFGVVLAARQHGSGTDEFQEAVESIRTARPTAVNLARMVDRVAARALDGPEALLEEALAVRDEEVAASLSMGRRGAALVEELVTEPDAVTALTICNTGGLAAAGRGTALGVIRTIHEQGRLALAIATETRPLLQGARLTAWELERMGAPYRVIVDAAGPALLSRGMADVVLTGADRIAANGDTANKIGTFSLALAARYASVPFVVVAPESTVDMDTPSGDAIRIEDRGADEVVNVRGTPITPEGTGALNPAFDVTPAELITAIVTDRRVVRLDRGETLTSVPPGDPATDTGG
ncbi:MAG: S-methyl-5-thioribose-1-phosphate isomerase [bacterium]|nr:S-methyl-5-thioribose-1-phosphate isomerase [bacterium]